MTLSNRNKMAIYYSIYSLTDDIRDSMFWILKLVWNLKFYMMNKIHEKIDVVVCTDAFTKNLLDKIIHQEKIDLIDEKMYNEHVHFKLFERIPNSHVGKMWRYLGLIDNKYDLVVSGEADDNIAKYFDIMNNLCCSNYDLYVLKYKSHWFDASILAGNIYAKPNLFSNEFRADWFRFLNALYTVHNKVPGWQDEIVSTFML